MSEYDITKLKNLVHFLKAGRLRQFIDHWSSICNDKNILQIIYGYKIEIELTLYLINMLFLMNIK